MVHCEKRGSDQTDTNIIDVLRYKIRYVYCKFEKFEPMGMDPEDINDTRADMEIEDWAADKITPGHFISK